MQTREELMGKISEELKEYFVATRELTGVADQMKEVINDKRVLTPDSDERHIVVTLLFAEAYSRFVAIQLLCEQGFGHSSWATLRGLLELLIIFTWLTKETSGERIRKYMQWTWIEKYREMRDRPLLFDPGEKKLIEAKYREVRGVFAYQVKDHRTGKVKMKEPKRWYEPKTIEELAREAKLTEQYDKGYRFLSKVVHVEPLYLLGRIRDFNIEYDPGFYKGVLVEALVMSFSYFLNICRETNDILSLGKSETLSSFIERQNAFKRGWEF
jgi:hypothetical protein